MDPTVPLAQNALRLCLSQPAVPAGIPGVRSAEQARCHLGMLGQDALPEVLLHQIEQCWQEASHGMYAAHPVRVSCLCVEEVAPA
jgi:aryl-alcohol dehydrogenase-like predicted oxidoreductase